jgi:hypothetical protein
VWIANPLDAFARRDQRLYLDWLDGSPAGDSLLRQAGPVVLVARGSGTELRLARDASFRRIARDSQAVLYLRTTQLTEARPKRHGAPAVSASRRTPPDS